MKQTSSGSDEFFNFSHSVQNWIFSWLNSFFKNSVNTYKPISSLSNFSNPTAHEATRPISNNLLVASLSSSSHCLWTLVNELDIDKRVADRSPASSSVTASD
jgi:hypothetical protein